MKKILVFIIASILSLGCSDAQSWKKQNTGFSTQRGISGIHIVDNTKVWAWTWDDSTGIRCRDFCKTSNGGNLWTTGTVTFTNSTSYIIGNIHAFSDFVSLAAMCPTNGVGGLIVKTTDGGNTWSTINSPNFSGSFLNFLHFFDNQNGICVGDPNGSDFIIYTTSDGGTTWNQVNGTNIPNAITDEWGFTDFDTYGNTIWFGTYKGRVFKSSDKGLTWTVSVISGLSPSSSLKLSFRDNNVGFVTHYNAVYKTTDGGTNWSTITPSGYYVAYPNFEYIPSTTSTWVDVAYAPNKGSSYSIDDCDNFLNIDTGLVQYSTVSFYDNRTGWAGGINNSSFDGGIYKWSPLNFIADQTTISSCSSVNFQENSMVNYSYWNWSFIGANPSTSSLKNPNNITYNSVGDYSVTLIASDGVHTDTITFINYIHVVPFNANSSNSNIICGGMTQLNVGTNYTGSGTLTYFWQPGTGLSSQIIENPIANPYSTIDYIVTVNTPTGGCSAKDTITVTVNPLSISATDKTIVCGASTLITTANNYTGSGTLTYEWSPSTALSTTNTASVNANPTSTINYTVTITSPGGYCVATDVVTVTVNPLIISGTDKTIVCGAETNITTSNNYTGTGTLTYAWSPGTALSSTTTANTTANPTSSIIYTVTVTTDNSCVAIDNVSVTVNPLTINAGTDKIVSCGTSATLTTNNNYTGTGTLQYEWLPATGLNNTTIYNPAATPITTTVYTVTVTTPGGGCVATDNVQVSNSVITLLPEICMVTVDPILAKNVIVWERPNNNYINGFNVYKEVSTNIYNWIGLVNFDDMSTFTDINSNPFVIASKYKISIADKCGFETAKSPYHKTVNLGVSQGIPSSTIVLSWNDYVEETGSFVPDKYFIYRGTLPDNLTVLDSISASFTSYNDINVFSAYYYVIGVRKLGGCTASSSAKTTETYNEALSNLKDNGLVGVSKFNQNDMLNIYPNPFDDLSTIEFYNPENNSFKLTLTDLSGRFVKVVNNITGNKVIIDRKDLKAGVYLIELKGKERNYQGRIMIE